MSEINFTTGSIAVFIRIPLEAKIGKFKSFLYAQNKVPNITWSLWAPIIETASDCDFDQFLKELYQIKYEPITELTTDDTTALERLFKMKDSGDSHYRILSDVITYLQRESQYQEICQRKPDAITATLSNTYWQLCHDDEAIYDILDEYYAGQEDVTLDTESVYAVADYTIKKIFSSFEFIKNYISAWNRNDLHVMYKTANQVLKKYDRTDKFDELYELIKDKSSSWVYSSYHKQFVFLDDKNIGHTDGVLAFVANRFDYLKWEYIPISEYAKCDEFIQQHIKVKGANSEKQSLGQFKRDKS